MKENDYILAVYEEKSFSKAAKRLFLSQPALSMAVKRVEDELGITIFDRSSLRLQPTDEGRIYIEALEEIRAIERNTRSRLHDLSSLLAGKIIASGENFVSSFILPEILTEFMKLYPHIQVELVESNSPELRKQLLSEDIDLLVAHDFDPKYYEAQELFEENVLLAVPMQNPVNDTLRDSAMTVTVIADGSMSDYPTVDLRAFRHEEFLTLKPGNDLHWRGNAICADFDFEPHRKIELDQLITSFNLTRAGLGISFVTDILVRKTGADGCFYYRIGHPAAKRKMSIGYKKNRYLTRAMCAFIDTARDVFRNPVP